ncbi:hypothetical protein HDU96_009676 [Phlyctochytrium bullatum]|nr:hypothetical protein HDU96_009676 [Phlyctochytrium bullatum]
MPHPPPMAHCPGLNAQELLSIPTALNSIPKPPPTSTLNTISPASTLPIELWSDILHLLTPREICRIRFLCRTFHDEVFPLALFRSLRKHPSGTVHVELKAERTPQDRSTWAMLVPMEISEGRLEFAEANGERWFGLESLGRVGVPYLSFLMVFWLHSPRLQQRRHHMSRPAVGTNTAPATQHSQIIDRVPAVRRYYVPVHDLPEGVHRVGGGGPVCTFEIKDKYLQTGEQRLIRIVRLVVNLRWGRFPLTTLAGLPRHTYAARVEALRKEIDQRLHRDGWPSVLPTVGFDPYDPRVLSFVEDHETVTDEDDAARRDLIDMLIAEAKVPRKYLSGLLASLSPDLAISKRRHVLETGLEQKGLSRDVLWYFDLSRRWVAEGVGEDGSAADAENILERLMRMVVEEGGESMRRGGGARGVNSYKFRRSTLLPI